MENKVMQKAELVGAVKYSERDIYSDDHNDDDGDDDYIDKLNE